MLGEHGPSQFVPWSLASIAGIPIDQAVPLDSFDRSQLADKCKHEGQHIIGTKGAIVYGISSIVSSICTSILSDSRNVHPLSHFQDNLGCCLSLPVVLGRKGILRTISPALNSEEETKLLESGNALREVVEQVRAAAEDVKEAAGLRIRDDI